jgi:hypothetical protein
MVASITCSIPELCCCHHPYLIDLRDGQKKQVVRPMGLKRWVVRPWIEEAGCQAHEKPSPVRELLGSDFLREPTITTVL